MADSTKPQPPARTNTGTWGEQGHAGEQVDVQGAREAFAELRRELSRSSRASAPKSPGSPKSWRKRLPLADVADDAERGQARPPPSTSGSDTTKRGDQAEGSGSASPKKLEGEDELEDFDLLKHVQNRRQMAQDSGLFFEKNLPVVWKNVTVKGAASSSHFVKDLPHAIGGTIFGIDLYNIVTGFFPRIKNVIPGAKVPERVLLNDFSGMIRDEMLLVLGRPGSGCSTFLRLIANQRNGFSSINGDVTYGGLSAEETARKFRGEVTYNPEDDLHFPTLTVGQTLNFAIDQKVPKRLPSGETKASFRETFLTTLLKMFSISHTRNTIVGNPFIVGISGGERKRVSIAETLVTKSAVTCWDNSTRGLDSASALQYGRSLRILTDTCGRGTVVTLYQMSESLYDLFDKVLLIDEGRCIFFGPAKDAREYFDRLGYFQTHGQTTADFLTSITDPQEVRFKEGSESSAPKTAVQREKVFKESQEYAKALKDVEEYEKERADPGHDATKKFKDAVRSEKSIAQRKSSIYTISLPASIWALTKRQLLLTWGDRQAFYTKTITNFSISLIVSSMFYGQAEDTTGAFTRGGVLFLSCLFLAWLNLTETYAAVDGRPIIQRHKIYAFYHPGAVSISRVLADLPLTAFQVTLFSVITYFLSSLRYNAGAFFIYYLFVLSSCFSITALYRAVAAVSGSFDTAIRFSVMYLTFGVVFAGYIVPRQDMPVYFRWIYYVQPVSYAFGALLSNEFTALNLACAPAQTVPSIPGADPAYQACAFQGAQPGSLTVNGNDYIRVAFGLYRSNLWPFFGYVWAYFFAYLAFDALASEYLSFVSDGASALVFARTKNAKKIAAQRAAENRQDEEEKAGYDGGAAAEKAMSKRSTAGDEHKANPVSGCDERPIFTWKDVNYHVPGGPDGTIQLLHNISGWVKPGEVTALMGASGAGKTTLLNTLSQRQPPPQVSGDILVDGKPLTKGFKREAGFAEQQDIHETSATVREALEFSALLRQPFETPREEKLQHVERILDLLDLRYLEDAIIGEPGAGLSVEQRKRVTIGVELAAKPSLIMFLDEPTSGLDSSGAYQIGATLRRLANEGQTVLCTIHQPSALLFTQFFDRLLLLQPGGRTAYFGAVKDIVAYFQDSGARHYEDHENVAEYILEIVGGRAPKGHSSWADVWEVSPQYKAVRQHIDEVCESRKPRPPATDPNKEREYAAKWSDQTRLLTQRIARNFWRDASYGYGKLWTVVILAAMNGFTFFNIYNDVSTAGLQQIMFSTFLLLISIPAFANASIMKHFMLKALWQAREGPSRTYSSTAFLTALLLNELPYAIACGTVYWVIWVFPIGLRRSEALGYTFLSSNLFFLFLVPWIHWLCSLAFSPTLVANVLPFFLVVLTIFNGIIVPWSQLPVIWKYWVYFMNPMTYLVRGMIAQVLHGVQVNCRETELAIFNPPPGQTCGAYAGAFASEAQGNLLNPDATDGCRYCPYTVGDQFTQSINGNYYQSWYEDFVIFLVFTITNIFLVFGIFHFFQEKGLAFIWTLSPVDIVKGMLRKKPTKEEEEEE